MKKLSKAGLVLCGAAFIHATAFAGEFLEMEPFFKSGRTITPQLELIDDNADSFPDRFKISYKVWTAGTTTFIRRTRVRTFSFPASPCTAPLFLEGDLDIKFTGSNSTDRVFTAASLITECEESGTFEFKEAFRALVYAGNVNDGTSWFRTWNGIELLGCAEVDWDTDGTNELMVVMAVPKAASDSVRVVFLDPSTGAVESDKTYAKLFTDNF